MNELDNFIEILLIFWRILKIFDNSLEIISKLIEDIDLILIFDNSIDIILQLIKTIKDKDKFNESLLNSLRMILPILPILY